MMLGVNFIPIIIIFWYKTNKRLFLCSNKKAYGLISWNFKVSTFNMNINFFHIIKYHSSKLYLFSPTWELDILDVQFGYFKQKLSHLKSNVLSKHKCNLIKMQNLFSTAPNIDLDKETFIFQLKQLSTHIPQGSIW